MPRFCTVQPDCDDPLHPSVGQLDIDKRGHRAIRPHLLFTEQGADAPVGFEHTNCGFELLGRRQLMTTKLIDLDARRRGADRAVDHKRAVVGILVNCGPQPVGRHRLLPLFRMV